MKKSKYPICYRNDDNSVICILSSSDCLIYQCICVLNLDGEWIIDCDEFGNIIVPISGYEIRGVFNRSSFSEFLKYAKKCKDWGKIWDVLYEFETEHQGYYNSYCI